MDRNIVYPGSIPLDTDLLSVNRNTMIALGFLTRAVLGGNVALDGLACRPTSPPSLSVTVGPGSITQLGPIDAAAYGSIAADTADQIIKMGINVASATFTLAPPPGAGQSVNYLIEAAFLELDKNPIVLPYYNSSNPTQTFSGPANSGATQNTLRTQLVQLQLKPGVPANTGSQTTPATDAGWTALYQITVAFSQTQVLSSNIVVVPTAPFVSYKLPALRPGFGSGVQSFTANGTFVVPAGVAQVEVEVWGAGAGSFASVPGLPSGGGSAGGYARKLVRTLASGQPLIPGQAIPIAVGSGGAGGTTLGAGATSGGTSGFGQAVSATGGSLNYLASSAQPENGGTPAGVGIGGDVNFTGSAGQAGIPVAYQGGSGGAAPMGGAQNSGTTGVPGTFPGGGAAGAGTGAAGASAFDGAAGGGGLVVVRW